LRIKKPEWPPETEARIYVFEELGLEFIYLIKTRTRGSS
jgi:hypothetical protein